MGSPVCAQSGLCGSSELGEVASNLTALGSGFWTLGTRSRVIWKGMALGVQSCSVCFGSTDDARVLDGGAAQGRCLGVGAGWGGPWPLMISCCVGLAAVSWPHYACMSCVERESLVWNQRGCPGAAAGICLSPGMLCGLDSLLSPDATSVFGDHATSRTATDLGVPGFPDHSRIAWYRAGQSCICRPRRPGVRQCLRGNPSVASACPVPLLMPSASPKRPFTNLKDGFLQTHLAGAGVV